MAQSDDEDDYMTMVFDEPKKKGTETSLQRRARIRAENEIKARVKSKTELEAEEAASRETGLDTAIDPSNKGFKLMAKLGYKPGETLGKSENARKEPIRVTIKENKNAGIGVDSEKKRKFREEMENEAKRVKVEEGDYRDRVRQENEEKRLEYELRNAQKTAQWLADEHKTATEKDASDTSPASAEQKPLKSINVLWRGLVRRRLEGERNWRIRKSLDDSLPRSQRLPIYVDEDEDADYKLALGRDTGVTPIEDDLDEDDPDLEAFEAQPIVDRLLKVVEYLRQNHHYCFWCKYKYPDATMEGCPGVTEEDH
ncbi:G-patch-domain-containing protein [Zopfia rhizophila CBS 207.26]|uniref:G-patch-domain-containing protein n=1 Tax=Zopfia rhizophila CBS 207.26 TaxID=1314779 RepID=A0A6A6EB80_9PEZI|nr:G-patch-domain-containing protein [Zopfia rhizophila CBS 207.26]